TPTADAPRPAENSPPSVSPNGNGDGTSSVEAVLRGVVSEKTGYPAEMLEPGMALDADLGIDSIKRVEILSAPQHRLPPAPTPPPPTPTHLPHPPPHRPPPDGGRAAARRELPPSRIAKRKRWRHVLRRGRAAGSGLGEDGVPGGDAGAGHGPGRRPGHRLHQA